MNDKHWIFLLGFLAVFVSLVLLLLWRFTVSTVWSLTQGSTNFPWCCRYEALTSAYSIISQFRRCSCSQSLSFCLPLFKVSLFLSLLHSSARPLPSRCGLSDLLVNLCGCSEQSLCYWKHPSNTPISHDVQMIGCAVFGYPFPIAGHDWSELPEMMSLLCDTAKKEKKKQGRGRKGGKGRRWPNNERWAERNKVREKNYIAQYVKL